MYEQMHNPNLVDSINHKEFITWNEFICYFEDYRDIEDRHRKFKHIRESLKGQEQVDANEADP